ncbi:hypothetical protein [Nocardia vermiculata]|uniref:Uncharacterized protein n=1 Tax=Nocardia vermiculata TaxID=257274 RepID=A0A846XQH2_9NOCA|nr:hypothetical protein [Nocardia vermiculata]NKY49286.1 hypothetical protein [Nocardia vermiculata]
MPTDEEFVDLEQLLEIEDGPRLIATHYIASDEAIEMVRAAQLLGLGVRLQNRVRPDEPDEDGDETVVEEWVLDLYESPPEAAEDEE